ncbi:serine hydrolase domain-containing protein [Mycolicibacterium setense]
MAIVSGTTANGFAEVQEAFAHSDLGRGGAAFAAYVDGVKVVDLWAGQARPDIPWERGTLATAMSATKGFAALCVQILADRGLLDVDTPVIRYWPEYGQAGKERTLVRHILNHTSGMLCFREPGDLLDWSGNGWDEYEEIARRIAASPAVWAPGTRIGYHAISVGWLIQELVRRVTGMTVGAFFASEVAAPLGLAIHIGTPEAEQRRLADSITEVPDTSGIKNKIFMALARKHFGNTHSAISQAFLHMHGGTLADHPDFFNLPRVRGLEVPAANGSADARSIARLYSVLAQGGAVDGCQIVSPASIKLFGSECVSGPSALWPDTGIAKWLKAPQMRYALGYEGDFGAAPKPWRFGPTPASFGHLGAGGQLGFADPVHHVAVGFLRNHHTDWSVSTKLVETLYGCLSIGARQHRRGRL